MHRLRLERIPQRFAAWFTGPSLGRGVGLAFVAIAVGLLLATSCVSPARRQARPVLLDRESAGLVAFTSLRGWSEVVGNSGQAGDARVFVSPVIRTEAAWNELIVSWNVEPADGAGLRVEALVGPSAGNGMDAKDARDVKDAKDAPPAAGYRMGDWSLGEGAPVVRTSHRGQKDAQATVKTDILVVQEPTTNARLRLTLSGSLAHDPRHLRLVTASFCGTNRRPEPRPARTNVWGRRLAVPERSQIAYPGGRGWCSPTSVSMVLAWWARESKKPEWDRDVPEVAGGVFDPGWGGTGNWPFNTAYAGSLPGMRACAVRLRDVRDLEDLIAEGIPVVMSVHPPALRGREVAPDAGHLIVCTGFTESGDVYANDPWARLEQGQTVGRVYRRADVERAWEHAHRLVYLIAPTAAARHWPIQWR